MRDKLKTYLFGFLSIAFIVLVVWSIGANGNQNAPGVNTNSGGESPFVAEGELSFDFGKISMAAGKVSKTFRFKNTAEGSSTITRLYTSCMCTASYLKLTNETKGPFGMPGHGFVPSVNQNINAGEEFEIEVIFDPAAHGPAGIGQISRIVTVENDKGKPTTINFSATVTP